MTVFSRGFNRRKVYRFKLGKVVVNAKEFGNYCYYAVHYHDVTLVIALPQAGKSAVVKILVIKMAKNESFKRPVLIFDPKKEWKDIVKPSSYIPRPSEEYEEEYLDEEDVIIIDNFAFMLEDMTRKDDWYRIGFTWRASDILCLFAKHKEIHHNSVKIFEEMLEDLKDIKEFNEKYPDVGPLTKKHNIMLDSLLESYTAKRDWFFDPNNEECKLQYVSPKDWIEALKGYKVVIVNFDYKGKEDREKAGLWVGKILELLSPKTESGYPLKYLKPIIICEEADYLFSNKSDEYYKSTDVGWQYANKFAKYYSNLILICQEYQNIFEHIRNARTQQIQGRLSGEDTDSEMNKDLQWDYEKNYRQLLYRNFWKKKGKKINYLIFEPFKAGCKLS
jgi:hypothetical protein